MLLETFFTDVYRPLRLRGKSANTTRLYGCLFRALARHLYRPPQLADLDELVLARYLDARAGKGLSPYTVERERNALLALARLARERGMLTTMPIVAQALLPEATPVAWTVAQMSALMDAAGRMPGLVGVVPAGVWWPALLSVLWETGERVTAIIETPAANYQRPHLAVPAHARKGGQRERLFTLSPETCDALDAIQRLTGGKGGVLPWTRNRTSLWGNMKQMVRREGLGEGRGFRFHCVRRSTASHFAAAGGDSTRLLGHSSPKLTSRWYLDPRITDTGPKPCDLLPRLRRQE
jgi:integrase